MLSAKAWSAPPSCALQVASELSDTFHERFSVFLSYHMPDNRGWFETFTPLSIASAQQGEGNIPPLRRDFYSFFPSPFLFYILNKLQRAELQMSLHCYRPLMFAIASLLCHLTHKANQSSKEPILRKADWTLRKVGTPTRLKWRKKGRLAAWT